MRFLPLSSLLLPAVAVVFLVACDRAGGDRLQAKALEPSGSKISTFDVRGVVKAVKPEVPSMVVAHEAITGYMEAMTMEFQANKPEELKGVEAGDTVRFRLTVTERRGWIDQIQKLGRAQSGAPKAPELVRSDGEILPLQAGDPVPDCNLLDQDGRSFSLGALHGDVVALTFIFTRCPYPDFCPRMAENFSAVQAELSAGGAPTNWKLVSVTIDPTYDTPERLAAYAKGRGADPGRWILATGDSADLEKLSASFGLTVRREGEQLNHNLRTVVIDGKGYVQKIFVGNAWTPDQLVAEMKRAAE